MKLRKKTIRFVKESCLMTLINITNSHHRQPPTPTTKHHLPPPTTNNNRHQPPQNTTYHHQPPITIATNRHNQLLLAKYKTHCWQLITPIYSFTFLFCSYLFSSLGLPCYAKKILSDTLSLGVINFNTGLVRLSRERGVAEEEKKKEKEEEKKRKKNIKRKKRRKKKRRKKKKKRR